jgi:hypothetical protein
MSKKVSIIFAILALLAVLILISVLKSSVDSKRAAKQVESMKKELVRTQDSLIHLSVDSGLSYMDSIRTLEAYYLSQIDSLNHYYADRGPAISVKSDSQANEATKRGGSEFTDSTFINVLADYKKMLKDLPGDLTEYELKVSKNELTVELSKKYQVSPDSVRKIIASWP